MNSPITYYGGKQKLASAIIEMIPEHKVYCEPFFGGGAVFFAKRPSFLECINDINKVLMTFYKVCMCEESFLKLQQLVVTTLHSESEWLRAKHIYHHPEGHNDIEIAWAVWLTTNMSFSGSPNGGWKWDNGTAGAHSGNTLNNYRNDFRIKLFERLRFTQISCRDALKVIKQRDSGQTFYYLDPPYPGCCQQHYKGYDTNDLKNLLELLETIEGNSCSATICRRCWMGLFKPTSGIIRFSICLSKSLISIIVVAIDANRRFLSIITKYNQLFSTDYE